MKMGFVSAILDGYSFEDVIRIASELDYKCVEVACWPDGKAERRYAGVSHIDVSNTNIEYVNYIKDYCGKYCVEISSLAFYPNCMDENVEKREYNIAHLKKVIDMSHLLGINMVTTFIGKAQTKNIEYNIDLFKQIWPNIINYAEQLGVKIAIENCPMLFDENQWPGGQNLMTTPAIWRKLFEIIDSDYFGLNYDPSHFVWQQMDYIKPLYEFKDKIFHVHYKDIKLYKEKLEKVGVLAYPLKYMAPKLPGLGDVNWSNYISALNDIGFDGCACIEIEDKSYEGSKEKITNSLVLSKRYLQQYII